MLGEIVDRLDDPAVAAALLRDLDEPDLEVRLAVMGGGEPSAEAMAALVRHFLDTASDEHWVQLIGIMSRADDPALEALRAILRICLPGLAAALHA